MTVKMKNKEQMKCALGVHEWEGYQKFETPSPSQFTVTIGRRCKNCGKDGGNSLTVNVVSSCTCGSCSTWYDSPIYRSAGSSYIPTSHTTMGGKNSSYVSCGTTFIK